MKILLRRITAKNGAGFVKLEPEENDDMYHIFNLISEGDFVTASTTRNVVKELATGATTKTRVHVHLKIGVEKIEFDSEQCSLRLNGKNVQENEHVKLGQYHTLELKVGESFSIEKECWDSLSLEQLVEASDPVKKAEVAAVVMQEGLACVCLITNVMTITKAKIEKKIPKKKGAQSQGIEKAKNAFFLEIFESIKRNINFDIVKVVLLGSPGFLKDEFMQFFEETATRQGNTALLRQKSKFLRAHTSCGYKHAIDEILGNPELQGQLGDVKASAEVMALKTFHHVLGEEQDRACYGFKSVSYADQQLAVDCLLVTDSLFKAADIPTRTRYVELVESVKEHGGKVFIFSSLHVSGEQLSKYTGVAATLRFPLQEPDEEVTGTGAAAGGSGAGGIDGAGAMASAAAAGDDDNKDGERAWDNPFGADDSDLF